jgi:hypothetical protein
MASTDELTRHAWPRPLEDSSGTKWLPRASFGWKSAVDVFDWLTAEGYSVIKTATMLDSRAIHMLRHDGCAHHPVEIAEWHHRDGHVYRVCRACHSLCPCCKQVTFCAQYYTDDERTPHEWLCPACGEGLRHGTCTHRDAWPYFCYRCDRPQKTRGFCAPCAAVTPLRLQDMDDGDHLLPDEASAAPV